MIKPQREAYLNTLGQVITPTAMLIRLLEYLATDFPDLDGETNQEAIINEFVQSHEENYHMGWQY